MQREFAVAYTVRCDAPEKLALAREWMEVERSMDRPRVKKTWSGGCVTQKDYTLADYFVSVEIASETATSFEVVFVPRVGMNSDWKGVMVPIMVKMGRDFGVDLELKTIPHPSIPSERSET